MRYRHFTETERKQPDRHLADDHGPMHRWCRQPARCSSRSTNETSISGV
jgi:hypothetical protein